MILVVGLTISLALSTSCARKKVERSKKDLCAKFPGGKCPAKGNGDDNGDSPLSKKKPSTTELPPLIAKPPTPGVTPTPTTGTTPTTPGTTPPVSPPSAAGLQVYAFVYVADSVQKIGFFKTPASTALTGGRVIYGDGFAMHVQAGTTMSDMGTKFDTSLPLALQFKMKSGVHCAGGTLESKHFATPVLSTDITNNVLSDMSKALPMTITLGKC